MVFVAQDFAKKAKEKEEELEKKQKELLVQ